MGRAVLLGVVATLGALLASVLAAKANTLEQCDAYSRRTHDQIRSLRDLSCLDPYTGNGTIGFPGPPERFGEGKGHFDFCMGGASNETMAREIKARQEAVTKCLR